jgi:putative endopeptidase
MTSRTPHRPAALAKLDAMDIHVGHPATRIEFSSVNICRDDYYGNVVRLHEFQARREIARLGKPVQVDGVAIAGTTLPIDIDAAYQMDRNRIEIPAAFLQPPYYDAKADAAVNSCSMGAVIGHELTHGFDSQGRVFDIFGIRAGDPSWLAPNDRVALW